MHLMQFYYPIITQTQGIAMSKTVRWEMSFFSDNVIVVLFFGGRNEFLLPLVLIYLISLARLTWYIIALYSALLLVALISESVGMDAVLDLQFIWAILAMIFQSDRNSDLDTWSHENFSCQHAQNHTRYMIYVLGIQNGLYQWNH